MTADYIRAYYGVPAKRGGRVVACGSDSTTPTTSCQSTRRWRVIYDRSTP